MGRHWRREGLGCSRRVPVRSRKGGGCTATRNDASARTGPGAGNPDLSRRLGNPGDGCVPGSAASASAATTGAGTRLLSSGPSKKHRLGLFARAGFRSAARSRAVSTKHISGKRRAKPAANGPKRLSTLTRSASPIAFPRKQTAANDQKRRQARRGNVRFPPHLAIAAIDPIRT